MLFLAILQQNQYSYMQQTARIRIIYVDTWELKDILMLSSEEEKVWGHIRINNVSPIDYIQRRLPITVIIQSFTFFSRNY